MADKTKYAPRIVEAETEPFESAEEAWFWFIQANEAKNQGVRMRHGMALIPRPCEPNDIMTVITRLHRTRRLTMHHLRVLKHYGLRMMPPEKDRPKEIAAYRLWNEAMERIQSALENKGIVYGRLEVS